MSEYSVDDSVLSSVKRVGLGARFGDVFDNPVEALIPLLIIKRMVESGDRLVLLETANIENLSDYAYVWSRLQLLGAIPLPGGAVVRATAVTDVPSGPGYAWSWQGGGGGEEYGGGFTPAEEVVGVFVTDIVSGGEQGVQGLASLMANALFRQQGYVVLFTGSVVNAYMTFPAAKFAVVYEDPAPAVVARYRPELAKYAHTVGFRRLLSFKSAEEAASYVASRRLPTPHTLQPESREPTLDELVLPDSLLNYVKINVVRPLSEDFTRISSILVLGPPGVGKTTLVSAIAKALRVPLYTFVVEMVGAKWVGETEKLANQTLLVANDLAPVVVYFRNIENLVGKRDVTSDAYEKVKGIIFNWVRSSRRRFLPVFGVSDVSKVDEGMLMDPVFGSIKLLVLPPLSPEHRRLLLERFISKIAPRYGLQFDPYDETTSEGLSYVGEETWGYTVRDIYELANIAVNVALHTGSRRVGKVEIQTALKYLAVDRLYRVEKLKRFLEKAKSIGMTEEQLREVYRFEAEVESMKTRAYKEKARLRGFARLS